jgi:hypothetical protein
MCFATVAGAACLCLCLSFCLLPAAGGFAAAQSAAAAQKQAPTSTPPPTSTPAPAAAAVPPSGDAAAKHAKRTACLKEAKAKKLVGADKTAFLKSCIAAP